MSDKLHAAQSNYRTWHQKEPDKVYEAAVAFPTRMVQVGEAETIEYHSDKWEEDGNIYPYVHDFDSKPAVYMDPDLVEGGSHFVSTQKLLGGGSLRAEHAVAILATVANFSFDPVGGGKRQRFDFAEQPLLVCTNDMKCVIILSQQLGPIVIRGGSMVVTERGIVR